MIWDLNWESQIQLERRQGDKWIDVLNSISEIEKKDLLLHICYIWFKIYQLSHISKDFPGLCQYFRRYEIFNSSYETWFWLQELVSISLISFACQSGNKNIQINSRYEQKWRFCAVQAASVMSDSLLHQTISLTGFSVHGSPRARILE